MKQNFMGIKKKNHSDIQRLVSGRKLREELMGLPMELFNGHVRPILREIFMYLVSLLTFSRVTIISFYHETVAPWQ